MNRPDFSPPAEEQDEEFIDDSCQQAQSEYAASYRPADGFTSDRQQRQSPQGEDNARDQEHVRYRHCPRAGNPRSGDQMTAKSRRKGNKGVRKTMRKRTRAASASKSKRGTRKSMRKSNLYASTSISSQGTPDAPAEPAAQRNPIAAEMICSGRGALGESNDKARMQDAQLNESASMFLQTFVHEWFEFFGKRTRQHMHLIKTIQGCRSLPDFQRAYSEFWQNAFTQYVEEPRRMLQVTQGAMDDVSHDAHGKGATQATLH